MKIGDYVCPYCGNDLFRACVEVSYHKHGDVTFDKDGRPQDEDAWEEAEEDPDVTYYGPYVCRNCEMADTLGPEYTSKNSIVHIKTYADLTRMRFKAWWYKYKHPD